MTAEELQLLVEKITEAEASYHQLLMGNKPRVFVDQNGERVEVVAANSNKLYLYIQSLKALRDAQIAPTTFGPIGPASFFF